MNLRYVTTSEFNWDPDRGDTEEKDFKGELKVGLRIRNLFESSNATDDT